MHPLFGRSSPRSTTETSGSPCITWGLAKVALVLALAVPVSSPQAKTDCGSLDIELAPLPEFTKVECDRGSFRGGGPSHTEEVIAASSSTSLFIIYHLQAGVRTYFERRDTKALLENLGDFATIENWSAAPGGDKFLVARFRGALTEMTDARLSCFGFSRFSGHVANSPGYRQFVYGFYCALQFDDVSDGDVRRLMAALKFHFE